MKKALITITIIITLITMGNLQARGSDVRLMDVNRILKSYGFKGGVFDQFSTSVNVLPFKSKLEFGKIENEITIDTAEEFITAVYYSPIELSASAKKSILAELPEGKTGALRVAAMWFFKIAEYPENREKYINAVNLVLKMSKEKHGVSVKLSEARKFYEEAIKEKIYATPLGAPLTAEEQKKVKELLLAYMLEPGERNAKAFKDYKKNLGSYNVEKSIAMMTFLKIISGKINIQLA